MTVNMCLENGFWRPLLCFWPHAITILVGVITGHMLGVMLAVSIHLPHIFHDVFTAIAVPRHWRRTVADSFNTCGRMIAFA